MSFRDIDAGSIISCIFHIVKSLAQFCAFSAHPLIKLISKKLLFGSETLFCKPSYRFGVTGTAGFSFFKPFKLPHTC